MTPEQTAELQPGDRVVYPPSRVRGHITVTRADQHIYGYRGHSTLEQSFERGLCVRWDPQLHGPWQGHARLVDALRLKRQFVEAELKALDRAIAQMEEDAA